MASNPYQAASIADLYMLPCDDSHHELTRGHLVSEPPPGGRHGRVVTNIVLELGPYARRTGAGVVYTCDTGYILSRNPDTVRAPDVSFLTRERYLALPDDTRLIPGPPTLAVEVLSPGDRSAQITRKVNDYLEFGTSLVWICDPSARTIRAISPGHDQTYYVASVISAASLLPGFELPLNHVFRPALER